MMIDDMRSTNEMTSSSPRRPSNTDTTSKPPSTFDPFGVDNAVFASVNASNHRSISNNSWFTSQSTNIPSNNNNNNNNAWSTHHPASNIHTAFHHPLMNGTVSYIMSLS
jgi:hypothetical protein